ncbi:hypothetical protein V6N11_043056 [Hibiscus sabdariffa]|uniref:tRNA-guanine(15) transglycosylase-like domain-containing protein n=1 Tax=Hibiscus sabdariffa TaxID=183260 RepID=A0ABR2QYT3_9ROSI
MQCINTFIENPKSKAAAWRPLPLPAFLSAAMALTPFFSPPTSLCSRFRSLRRGLFLPLLQAYPYTNEAAVAETASMALRFEKTWLVFLVAGTIKGLATNQLEDIGCQIILGNTYHLALRPTSELIDELGGLHKFMNWPRALLTDSGADITEKGVTFQSPVDGKPMLLTPEESIQIQNRIGADIIMALDDVVKTTITGPRIEEAMYRTLRWIDRCIAAHKRPHDQNLFGIVQGGLDPVLRDICVRGLVDRNLPGYAIGGLAGGEDKDSFWRVVVQCTAALPEDKPRYVMGVG